MELIKCFKALSDKTRLRLLVVLYQYELNVNEIVQVINMIQSGVSRHLKILLESGLLTSRKDGSFTYYSIARTSQLKPLIQFVHQRSVNDQAAQNDLLRAKEMIEIRQSRTKRFFKTVAPQWDSLKQEVLGGFDLDTKIIEKISFTGKILDLGCGTGELIQRLIPMASHKLIGIDSSPEMLEQARLRLSKTNNSELRLGELEHLPMRNKEIKTAIMNMVLHHISQPEKPIAEAFRVIKSGGYLILSDFEKHDKEKIKNIIGSAWMGFEKTKIESWLTEAGFHLKNIDSHHVNHGLTVNIYTAVKT